MLDDTSKLLRRSRQKAGHVHKGHDWDLKGITKTNEARGLDTSVDVEHSSQHLRLVSNDAHRTAFHFCKASDNVLGEVWHNLVELVSVDHTFKHGHHVVRLVRVVWNDIIEDFRGTLVQAVLFRPGALNPLFRTILR